MRTGVLGAMVACVLAWPAAAHEGPHDARRMDFPKAAGGGEILAVDLHTHSVFSDGEVWPSIRVEEAKRDGLAAMAVTEHIEYQPHAADIPHPDRNRSYKIASGLAKDDFLIIPGSEITRGMPPGHVNAVFITDANALVGRQDPEVSIREANQQGAFVFWNHPYWLKQQADGVARLTPMHERLIAAKQMQGIEVANGADYSESAFRIALANNLAILGTSDIHGLIDWDYDIPSNHRTVTLVLAKAHTSDAIKAALQANRTVAWYRDSLIGRPPMVEEVVRSSLSLEAGGGVEGSKVLAVTIRNASPVRYTLRLRSPQAFYNAADIIAVPPNGAAEVHLTGGVTKANLALEFEVLNSLTAPRQTLSLTLRPKS